MTSPKIIEDVASYVFNERHKDTGETFNTISDSRKNKYMDFCNLAVSAYLKVQWQDISTAPKDGTEILAYREDAGVILVRWTSCAEFLTEREIENSELDEDGLHQENWFYADFVGGDRLESDLEPTHFMPLPPPPSDGDLK